MIYAILIAAGGVALTAIKWAFFPYIPWQRLPATASATCTPGSTCACTPAPGTLPPANCGCGGGGWPCSTAAAAPAQA